jgi:hypothetical protein
VTAAAIVAAIALPAANSIVIAWYMRKIRRAGAR